MGWGASAVLLSVALVSAAPESERADPQVEVRRVKVLAGFVSTDAAGRAAAVRAAGQDGAPVFIGPLLARIEDPAPEVRAAAATALGQIGVPPSALDLDAITRALRKGADDRDDQVAQAALLALGRYPFPAVQRTLARRARSKKLPPARRAWARAALVDADPEEAAARMADYLALTRAEAARGVDRIPPPEVRWQIEPNSLLAAARDLLSPTESLRWGAAQALSVHPDEDARFPFLVAALREEDPATRRVAAGALAKQGDLRAARALESSLADPDSIVRLAAVDGVATRKDAASVGLLLGRYRVESTPEVLARLEAAIAAQPEAAVLGALARWPSDPQQVALRGVELAAARTSTAATERLVGFVAGAQHRVVVDRAAQHLAERPDGQVVPAVLLALAGTKPGQTQQLWLTRLLKGRRHPSLPMGLLDIVADGRASAWVMEVVAQQPEAEVRPRLLALVRAEDPRVRDAALKVARGYVGPDAVEPAALALERAPSDPKNYAWLNEQDPELLLPVRLRLLRNTDVEQWHRFILRDLSDTRSPALPDPVAEAVLGRPKLAPAAIDLLEQQPPKPAAAALARIAADPKVADGARADAIEAMVRLAKAPPQPEDAPLDPDAVEEDLRPLGKDEAQDVRYAARNGLHDLKPTVYPSWDPYGRVPLIVEGAAFGAGLMIMSTEIAEAELSPAFVGGAGAVLGGATPFLLTLNEDVTLGDAGVFGTYGLWGTGGGLGLGLALGLDKRDVLWSTVGGEALGVGAGALALAVTDWGLDDVAFANFSALETGVLGAGITALILDGDERRNEIALGVGLLSGAASLAPLAFLTRDIQLEGDMFLLGTAMTHGAFLGAVAPGIFFSDGLDAERMALGAALGQSAGYLAGLGWARAADLRFEDAAWSFFGASVGAAALGGLGYLLEDADPRLRFGLLEGGMAVGGLTLGLVGRDLEFRDNDAWVVALMAGVGALAGSDLSVRIEEDTLGEPGLRAGLLMGAGFGTAAGLLASQFVDLSDKTLWYSVLGGGVGVAAGIGLGGMTDLGVRDRSRISSAFAVAGTALTLPFAETLDLSGRTIAYGAAAGGVLGGLAAFTPYYYADGAPEAGKVGSAALFGAALGTYAGIGVAQALELELKETGQVTLASLAAAGFGGGLGLVIPETDDAVPVALAQGLGLATFATTSGLAAAGLWRGKGSGPKDGAPSALRYGALGLHGALHGALIPLTWRDDADDVPGREVGGGLMLGTSAGVLLGLAARGLGAPRLDTPDLLEVSLLTSTAYALGGGVGLMAEDRRLGLGLVQGLGLATYAGAWLAAPHTTYDRGTPWTLGLGAGLGAWFGGWSARLFYGDPAGRQVGGGVLAGVGAGTALGALWTQLQDDRQEEEVFFDAAFGAALGGGLALALDPSERGSAGLVQAGTGLGLGLGLAFAPYTEFSAGDRGLVGLAASLGAVHGAFVPPLFGEADARAHGGASLVGSALGFGAGSLAAQWTELTPPEVIEIGLLTAGADTFGGGLALSISDLDPGARAAFLHAAGAAGLVAGALVAPHTKYELDDASLVTLTGVVGGFAGSFLPSAWEDGDDVLHLPGAIMGVGAGSIAGMVLSQTYRLGVPDQLEAALMSGMGTAMGGGLVLLLDEGGRGVAPWLAGGASLGLAGGIAFAPKTGFSARDRGLVGYSTAMGAWHGLWLSSLWGDTSAEARAGGALLGVGAGWVAGSAIAQLSEVPAAALVKGSLLWGVGAGLGGGLGLLLPGVSGQATAGLMEGLGAAGAIAGVALSDRLELEDGDLALVPAGTLFGAALGLTLPAFVADDPEAGTRGGGVLLGASAGALAAGVVSQLTTPAVDDVVEASLTSIFAQGFGLGLGMMIPDSGERLRFALLDGFGAVGLGAGLWLSRFTDFDEDSGMTLLMGGLFGGGLGALTPAYYNAGKIGDASAEQIGGGVLLGATAGLATAAVLDQAFDLGPTKRNHAALGATLGGLTGGGLGLLLSTDDRVAVGLTQGLAAAGAGAVGATLADFEYDAGDLALGSAYVGYLTWHSMGLTLLLDGTNRQAGGVAVGTVGLGALTGMYLAPHIDMTLSDTLMLLAGNVWGTWIGGWGGALLADSLDSNLDGRRQVGLTLISTVLGSDIGLTVTGLVVGGLLDVPPTQFAFINLGGLGGMLIGMLGAGFADGEPLKAGNVIGSLSGLVAGAVITSFFDWSSGPTWDELLSRRGPELTPKEEDGLRKTSGPTGFGVEQWMPSAQVVPSADGEPQYLFTVSGTFR